MEPEMEAMDPMLTTVTTMTTRTVTVTKQPTIILAAAGNPQLHPQHSVSPPIVTIKTEPADQLSDAMEQTGVLIFLYTSESVKLVDSNSSKWTHCKKSTACEN